jgi:hypothetical protein
MPEVAHGRQSRTCGEDDLAAPGHDASDWNAKEFAQRLLMLTA